MFRRAVGWLVVCVILAGCGGGTKLPPLQRVTGKVTLDGNPLPRGTVQFQPAAGTVGPPATGTIGADGSYELITAGEKKGAIIGKHTVTVEARAEPKDHTDTYPMSLIPEKYNSHTTSGIEKEVTADKANVHDIELKSN
jgi:hypothetical protein